MSDEPKSTEAEQERDEYLRSSRCRETSLVRRRFREHYISPLHETLERTRRWSFLLFLVTAAVVWLACRIFGLPKPD